MSDNISACHGLWSGECLLVDTQQQKDANCVSILADIQGLFQNAGALICLTHLICEKIKINIELPKLNNDDYSNAHHQSGKWFSQYSR